MKLYEKRPTYVKAEKWFCFEKENAIECEIKHHKKLEDDNTICQQCGITMKDHGWINTLENGYIICPGDFIVKPSNGECYPVKETVFNAIYTEVQK